MAIVSAPHHDGQTPHRTKPQMAAYTTLLILAAIGVVLLARDVLPGSSRSSGVPGSGVAATSTRALPNFSGMDLAGSNNVTVVAGARQSVVVHADSNLLSRVTTQVKAGTLIIGDVGSFEAKSPMYVEVSVPSLTALDLSGSGNITVTGIRASRLTVTVPGSGDIAASGSVARLNAESTAPVMRNSAVSSRGTLNAVVSGSGTIFVTATQSLDAKVPGSGAVFYSGNPAKVTTSITGSGAVTPGWLAGQHHFPAAGAERVTGIEPALSAWEGGGSTLLTCCSPGQAATPGTHERPRATAGDRPIGHARTCLTPPRPEGRHSSRAVRLTGNLGGSD